MIIGVDPKVCEIKKEIGSHADKNISSSSKQA